MHVLQRLKLKALSAWSAALERKALSRWHLMPDVTHTHLHIERNHAGDDDSKGNCQDSKREFLWFTLPQAESVNASRPHSDTSCLPLKEVQCGNKWPLTDIVTLWRGKHQSHTHTPVMCKRMCYRDWSWGIISAWSAAREKRAIWFLASDATCEADLSDPWSYLWTKHIAVQSLAKRRWITRDSRMIREIGTCNAIWSNTYLQESKARSLKSSGLLQ